MGGYIVGLTAMALLCGIVTSLAEKDTAAGKVINLMCSVCMLLCILRPVLQLRPHDFRDLFGDLSSQGQEAVQQGKDSANLELESIMISKTEAYILDKATVYGADVSVEVTLRNESLPVPAAVTIRGNCSPYAQQRLSEMMAEDLSIGREAQVWIVEN
jgi:hypothetical protein